MTAGRSGSIWLGFQGSRLHLELDGRAAVQLRDALNRALRGRADSAPVQRVWWRLPDGRPLDLSLRLTDGGVDDDVEGPAHGDVSGDFAVHVAACRIIAAGTDDYPHPPGSPEDAEAHDYRRIDDALDRHLPRCNGTGTLLRDDIRTRAVAAADATRSRRLAEVASAAS